MRMTCNTCKNSAKCSFSLLEISSRHIKCNHYQIEQNIVTRDFSHFGAEYLSRPREPIYRKIETHNDLNVLSRNDLEICYEKYFENMNVLDHNRLLREVIFKLKRIVKSEYILPKNIFLNVEKFSLLDRSIIKSLFILNRDINRYNKKLIVEITERHTELDYLIIQIIPELKDKGLTFALDDFLLDDIFNPFIKYFDFIKTDITELYNKHNSYELIYHLIENKKQIVVEKISTKEQLDYALTHPVHYIQGFYI
ncbi:EAL domain-containing protein [Vibrio alginolyticus]|uniref:EAL domain-containing protein n=2 Tax=Vibrio alginolyticus TaxID=663 RepID=UPI00215ED4FC|nr:EAL domain-containing protein [Vibrio alginolyticus]MCS0137394.1 EAL domain-containing protein [Vibrio alginolyticus]